MAAAVANLTLAWNAATERAKGSAVGALCCALWALARASRSHRGGRWRILGRPGPGLELHGPIAAAA
jgi:hypothetical protein